MRVGVNSIENDRKMRQEFGYNIESAYKFALSASAPRSGIQETLTPYGAKYELYGCILFPDEIQTDCNGRLPNHDCPNMVAHTNWRDCRPIKQLKDVHSDEHLGNNE